MGKRKVVDSGGTGWFRWMAVGVGFVIFTAASGWWLFASDSDSEIRKTVLSKASVMVDRIDELSEAWSTRRNSLPGKDKEAEKPKPVVVAPKKVDAPKTVPPEAAKPGRDYNPDVIKEILAEQSGKPAKSDPISEKIAEAEAKPDPVVKSIPAPTPPPASKPSATIKDILTPEKREPAPRPVYSSGENAEIPLDDKEELNDIFRKISG